MDVFQGWLATKENHLFRVSGLRERSDKQIGTIHIESENVYAALATSPACQLVIDGTRPASIVIEGMGPPNGIHAGWAAFEEVGPSSNQIIDYSRI